MSACTWANRAVVGIIDAVLRKWLPQQPTNFQIALAYTHWILPSNQHSPAASNIQTRISAATTAKTDLICLKNAFFPWLHPQVEYPSAPQGAQESSVDLPPRRCARRSAHTSCPRQRCCTSARDIPPSYTDRPWWLESCWVFIGSDLAEDKGSNLGDSIVWSTERAPTT